MDRWQRRSIRLADYDYTQPGAYFVTACIQGRECSLGGVRGGEVDLSLYGEIVQRAWDTLPDHYPHVELDAFIIMPNHVHGIIMLKDIVDGRRSRRAASKRRGLPEVVRAFKAFPARRINEARETPGTRVWQCNYYEHIIRDERELGLVREYVVNNPLGWDKDPENPLVRQR